MTKLPQSLEKEIEQSAITYANEKTGTSLVYSYWPVHDAHKDGGTKHALAVLEKAEKLAEALQDTLTTLAEVAPAVKMPEAERQLAEWEEWKK